MQFPDVLFENCSSGGGRFDAGMSFYMPQTWCSDNTDALDRQKIQYGASYVFPHSAITAHISAAPNHQTGRNIPFATRAAVASSANMGYELNILELSSEEKEQMITHLSEYKSYILKIPYVDSQKVYVEKNTGRSFTGEELIYVGISISTLKGDFPVIVLEFNEKK